MRGLLTYSFYSIRGSLMLLFAASLISAFAFIITGHILFFTIFTFSALGGPPYILLTKTEGTANWERYLASTPVKRTDLATNHYISVVLSLLLGLVSFGIVLGISFLFHDNIFSLILYLDGALTPVIIASIILIMSGFLFPLSFSKFGENRQSGLFMLCLGASVAIVIGTAALGSLFGTSPNTDAILLLSISITIFIVSLIISRNLYRKVDF